MFSDEEITDLAGSAVKLVDAFFPALKADFFGSYFSNLLTFISAKDKILTHHSFANYFDAMSKLDSYYV